MTRKTPRRLQAPESMPPMTSLPPTARETRDQQADAQIAHLSRSREDLERQLAAVTAENKRLKSLRSLDYVSVHFVGNGPYPLQLVCLTEDDSDAECGEEIAEVEPGDTWDGLEARIAEHAAGHHDAPPVTRLAAVTAELDALKAAQPMHDEIRKTRAALDDQRQQLHQQTANELAEEMTEVERLKASIAGLARLCDSAASDNRTSAAKLPGGAGSAMIHYAQIHEDHAADLRRLAGRSG